MGKPKLIRITTIPLSLEKLLEGQLGYMKQWYDVTAVSADRPALEAYGQREGIPVHPIELTRKITPFKDLIAVWKLYRFLRRERPEIVHTHTPKAGIVGMLGAYLAGVPHRLHTVAGLPLMEAKGPKRKLLNFIEKLTYRFATGVYPNSKGLYDFIVQERFIKPKKLKIIGKGSSNGIDTTYFSRTHFSEEDLRAIRSEFGIPDTTFIYVFVGRIVKDKGINEMVAAFSKLYEEKPKVTLLLVGPFEDDLDAVSEWTSKTINEHEGIITTGYQTDVRPFFALSDALVFPSYREGFPNVVMQACAMELPCIVSDINGCNEIITENENGKIVPAKDEEALFHAMKQLREDEVLFERLAKSSRSSIKEQFERSYIWGELSKEYENLLNS
ncbi:glycosyltransferase family 4 protein [Aureisphaera galaxeae]|uniref:glycosyltransferase family 4 protein n=1 Tax=Aureisphaera galaxeae TaxID=1538023 RepID=UPI00235007EE|nr:glycosyltransferase family 4 protein [Aureisphaera galaxeae]MDC8004588.1 glycosyltransferase family 4 protein [Aureisphaera galaxeae]